MKKSKIKEFKKQGLLDKDFKWNDGYYLECMDRLHTIQVMISEILDKHPVIILSGNQNNLEDIQRQINRIYQDIGAMEYEESK